MEKEPRKPDIGTYIALGLAIGTVLGSFSTRYNSVRP